MTFSAVAEAHAVLFLPGERTRVTERTRLITDADAEHASLPQDCAGVQLSAGLDAYTLKSPRVHHGFGSPTPAQISVRFSYQDSSTDNLTELDRSEPGSPLVSLPSFLSTSSSGLSSSSSEDISSLVREPTAPYPLSMSRRHVSSPRTTRSLSGILQSPTFCLASYFLLNLGLTLHNKLVLVGLPFPCVMTALHALFSAFGAHWLRRRGWYTPAKLNTRDSLVLLAFSVLYTINIGISNASLHLVSIPFHQVVRGTIPLFTIGVSAFLVGTTCSRAKWFSLAPVVLGAAFATYGDYSFTIEGLFLTVLGAFLAALKTVLTKVLQSPAPAAPPSARVTLSPHQRILATVSSARLAMHPLDLLARLSPLAFVQSLVYAALSGELRAAQAGARTLGAGPALGVLANATVAFALNVASFSAARRTSPVAMSVAGNVKQVLTVVTSVMLFSLPLSPVNMTGIALSLVGGAWYARVEFLEKARL